MNKIDYELRVVLASPIYERNVGATSRAMSNMGFEKLILVSPQCEITFDAQQAAATGQTALQNRTVYSSWNEFEKNEPDSIRIAFTTKDGKARQVRDLKPTLDWIQKHSPQFSKPENPIPIIHFVFGREDWGLSSEDIENCNFACCLPTFGENPSLNLAQAVLIALFIIREHWGGSRTPLEHKGAIRSQSQTTREFPDAVLKEWLEVLGFDLDRGKVNAFAVLKRILLQNTPDTKEVKILEAVVQQTIRKLKEWKDLQKFK
ncbi:MAG: RNA methyltransferase [Bdellovibrionales bacterium]